MRKEFTYPVQDCDKNRPGNSDDEASFSFVSTRSGNETLVYRLRNVSFGVEFDVRGRFRLETGSRRESEHLLKHSNDTSEAYDALKANETSLKP